MNERVTSNVKLAKDIREKIARLGMQRYPASVGVDLADVYFAVEKYKEFVDRFLTVDINDKKGMADALGETETELEHISFHIRSVRRGLSRIIDYLLPDEPSPDKKEGPSNHS